MELRFKPYYICRNCEDEFDNFPEGERLSDHLPLCLRCTELGVEEGVAMRYGGHPDQVAATHNGGIAKIGIFVIIVCFAIALAVYASFSRQWYK